MIKKLLFLLVLLLTATTGAWAQEPVDGTIAWSDGNEASVTVSASIKDAISSTGVTTGSGLTVSTGKYFDTDMVKYRPATANAGNVEGVMIEYTIEAVDGYKFKPTGVDYAAVKDGTDNASYSWSYTIDGVESAITDVSMNDVLRNNGSNSGTAQLMHSESITADGCSVFTLRFYISNCGTSKNICIGNITISGSVSAAPATGYSVTLAEGTEDAGKWTIDPTEAAEGTTVTVTYSGTKKVKSVKAVKKAGDTGKSLAEATVGMIIGSNGKAYAAADKDNLPSGVTAAAKVCYVDGNGHGLALALTDEVDKMNWSTAQTVCAAHTPAITGGTWKLASKGEWNNMISAAGSYSALRDGFSSVGGTNMESGGYWSSTEDDSSDAWNYYFSNGLWSDVSKNWNRCVRACLAF